MNSTSAVEILLSHVRACLEDPKAKNLEEAERMALDLAEQVKKAAFQALVEPLAGKATYQGTSVSCGCGERARFVGYRRRWIRSLCGEVHIARAYYHCSQCQSGLAPWDHQQGLSERVYTPALKATVAEVMASLAYAEGTRLLQRLGIVNIEESSAEAVVIEVGSRLRASQACSIATSQREAQQKLAAKLMVMSDEAAPAPACTTLAGERLYVSIDGAHAHIDGDWHEVKCANLYSASRDAKGHDRLVQRRYLAAQESSDDFGWRLRAMSADYRVAGQGVTVALADGAEYNWRLAEQHFPEATQILDFMHVCEHIHQLANILYGEGNAKGKRWANDRCDALREQGPASLLRAMRRRKGITEAQTEAIRKAYGYFSRNEKRMQYPQYESQGMMIGSGNVEAACKTIVGHRLKQAGMRWKHDGADAILAIRSMTLCEQYKPLQDAARAA